MKKYAHLGAKAQQENLKNKQKYFTQFFNQHSKYKKEPNCLNPSDPNPELTSTTSQASNDDHDGYSDNSKWYKEMKVSNFWISYDSSTSTSYKKAYGTTNSYWSYAHDFHKPSIGEEQVPVPKDSTSKTFMQHLEDFHHENDLLHKLCKKQSMKLHQEYHHEIAEFHKALELEKQQENLPIFMIEFAAAKVFLQYYANMALQKPPPPIKIEQVIQVAKYLAATITCELRHRNHKCVKFWSRALHMWTMLDEWGVSNCGRQDAGKQFLTGSADWDGFMVERYLKLGAYIFGGKWEGGYGGWPWASVAWYASEWVFHAVTKGEIPVILWEQMLNAAHNNGRWMNKLGMGNVMGVLNMGANASPSFITEIAKKALIVDNPNDFRRIIEKWAECNLPGEKNKLELPNPGVEVEVHLMRSSGRKSYIEKIQKLEEKAKDKTIILDAPDKAPVEMKDGESMPPSSKPTVTSISAEEIKQAILKATAEGKTSHDVLKKGIQLPWKITGSPLKPPQSFGLALDIILQSLTLQVEKQNPLLGIGKVPVPPISDPEVEKKVSIGELIKEKLDFGGSIMKKKIFAPKPMPPYYPETEMVAMHPEPASISAEEFVASLDKKIPHVEYANVMMSAEHPTVKEMSVDIEAAEEKILTQLVEEQQVEVAEDQVSIPLEPGPEIVLDPGANKKIPELNEGFDYPKPKPHMSYAMHEPPEIALKKSAAASPNKYSTKGDGFTLVEEWEAKTERTTKEEGGAHEQVAAG